MDIKLCLDGAKLLKIVNAHITPSLACVMNLTVQNGKFPTHWKTAKVAPLYKSVCTSEVC